MRLKKHVSTLHRDQSSRACIVGQQAIASFQKAKDVITGGTSGTSSKAWKNGLCCPSQDRRERSLLEEPFQVQSLVNGLSRVLEGGPENPDTVLYLAYGSNLCAKTFQGKRGIRPIAQVNVVVPELVMTFDLPGLPYVEPCFANTKYRKQPSVATTPESSSEKAHLMLDRGSAQGYHKDRWHKGLVGVVYEVTRADYAHIIATEGGGASYQDIIVDCYELPTGAETVPNKPTSQPFKAHTLFAPALPPDIPPPKDGGRFTRPDRSYAQASARYLKLIRDGADEHKIPREYKRYLGDLRPYTIKTAGQRLGQFIFLSVWLPLITFLFTMNGLFVDDKGRNPPWLIELSGAIFKGMWASYDSVFKDIFGDGERTIETNDDEDEDSRQSTFGEDDVPGYGSFEKRRALFEG
ncbi:hypothetical protein MMC06_001394 [Schaereria dolodes]|nr:hypothetical protein [Schaereria dolodes]